MNDKTRACEHCSGTGVIDIPLIPEGAEEFESADQFPGLRFKDNDGDWTKIWVKDAKSYYWMAETGEEFARIPGHPLAMVRSRFRPGEVFVCPRDRMADDGGFHSPAMRWLKKTWAEMEAKA